MHDLGAVCGIKPITKLFDDPRDLDEPLDVPTFATIGQGYDLECIP